MQAQMLLLKSAELQPFRDTVNSAVEQRHWEVRKLWGEMLEGIGVQCTPQILREAAVAILQYP
jgi:predicted membrane chloride channel (bestrophin family)